MNEDYFWAGCWFGAGTLNNWFIVYTQNWQTYPLTIISGIIAIYLIIRSIQANKNRDLKTIAQH